MATLKLDPADIPTLKPIIIETVTAVLGEIQMEGQRLGTRLAYTEPEAARLLGLPRHSLRDLRLRSDVEASKLGSRVVYTQQALLGLIARKRI